MDSEKIETDKSKFDKRRVENNAIDYNR